MTRHVSAFVLLSGLLFYTSPGGAKLTLTASESLPLIDELNASIQGRLLKPLPKSLGMSRIMVRSSFGEHFRPILTDKRDFAPENDNETKVIAALEERKLQVGLYLFGDSILREDAKELSFRALKGPGSITINTPRPNWYPSARVSREVFPADATNYLPDWNTIYPIAQRAMRSFKDGGSGFEMQFQSWTIAARPAVAVSEKCISCHNNRAYPQSTGEAKLGEPLGGVLYAFRTAKAD